MISMMMAISMMGMFLCQDDNDDGLMIYESHVEDDGCDNGFAAFVRLTTKEMARKYPTYLLGEGLDEAD